MCGAFINRVLREAGAVNILVIISRWFGGILLGPDRWRLMRHCVTQALSKRLCRPGVEISLGGEALWALDLEAMRSKSGTGSGHCSGYRQPVVGAVIHQPDSARDYLLKSFAPVPVEEVGTGRDGIAADARSGVQGATKTPNEPRSSTKAFTKQALDAQKEENLSLLLGALRMLYDSWADHLTPDELDARAWNWYVAVRPDVESGVAGWGAKGVLRLRSILDLRRKIDGPTA
jgi:Uncharacterized protein family UPF0029